MGAELWALSVLTWSELWAGLTQPAAFPPSLTIHPLRSHLQRWLAASHQAFPIPQFSPPTSSLTQLCWWGESAVCFCHSFACSNIGSYCLARWSRPANSCIPPSFPWMAPTDHSAYFGSQGCWGGGRHLWVRGALHLVWVPSKRRMAWYKSSLALSSQTGILI
jgi:hypothetical protein